MQDRQDHLLITAYPSKPLGALFNIANGVSVRGDLQDWISETDRDPRRERIEQAATLLVEVLRDRVLPETVHLATPVRDWTTPPDLDEYLHSDLKTMCELETVEEENTPVPYHDFCARYGFEYRVLQMEDDERSTAPEEIWARIETCSIEPIEAARAWRPVCRAGESLIAKYATEDGAVAVFAWRKRDGPA